jgi:diacylglycerol kinase family enzyme
VNIQFVVNPISGDIDKEEFTRIATKRCELAGHAVNIFETTGENDEKKIQSEVKKNRPDRILSLGGDGNFILCCTAVEGKNIPVGLIPMGSANGLAMELGIPKNHEEALDFFLDTSEVRHMDVICVNGDKFCAHLGDVGINAEIVQMYDEDENRGMLTYAKYLTRALAEAEPFSLKVQTQGETVFDGNVVMVGLGNCRQYGTGVYLTKDGNPFDGKFEIVLIYKMDFSTVIKKGLTIFNREIAEDQNTEVLKLSDAKLSLDKPRELQLDGEPQGEFKEISIQLLKAHFPVVISSENSFTS